MSSISNSMNRCMNNSTAAANEIIQRCVKAGTISNTEANFYGG